MRVFETLDENANGSSVIIKVTSFSFCLEMMYIDCYWLILLFLDFHKTGCVDVNTCVTKLEVKNIFNIIPALAGLKCLAGKVVS